jgi:hypothetical protein
MRVFRSMEVGFGALTAEAAVGRGSWGSSGEGNDLHIHSILT